MFESNLLSGKVILVTGGGTGLGLAMATRFGQLGAKLALASRSQDHVGGAAAALGQKGIDVLAIPCDVRDAAAVDAMVAQVVARWGRVDCLVNNAAGNFLCPSEQLSPGGFDAVVRIVLYGSFHCSLAAGRQMIAQGTGGSILSIVTPYAWTGSAYVLPSAMAKAGVLAMTRSLAVEWARHSIRVNAIAPGPFPTEGAWQRLVPPGMGEDMLTAHIPARRVGRHDELANLGAYLLADGSAYITGDVVTIDGGRWLMGGEFNELTRLDPNAVAQMMAAMRPPKR
jgi:NAD(P)-dependent dehydrogenase (short-subunit alcohol dehydrogenase family)